MVKLTFLHDSFIFHIKASLNSHFEIHNPGFDRDIGVQHKGPDNRPCHPGRWCLINDLYDKGQTQCHQVTCSPWFMAYVLLSFTKNTAMLGMCLLLWVYFEGFFLVNLICDNWNWVIVISCTSKLYLVLVTVITCTSDSYNLYQWQL